jgi:hypothetical protein
MNRFQVLGMAVPLLLAAVAVAQTREEKVRGDRQRIEAEGFWIYNDLPRGFAEAKKTGKPMLLVFRCIPCEECVKLDDDLIHADKRVRPLLEEFVRVRVVSANGLDLSLFQFDTDQSFAAFLLNGDGTIYGRYGTRSHHSDWEDDVSYEGLAQALEGALALHRGYPANKASLMGKRGPAPDVKVPELYPLLKGKYTSKLDYEGNVVRSCIHCHQVGDAQRQAYRDKREPLPENVLFPYPHPKSLGLILDPTKRATVLRVDPGTDAARAGFQPGDVIESLEGQPLLSTADVQWVLHRASPDGASLKAQVLRGGKPMSITVALEKGWRRRDNISWRASSWELRRMVTGGMLLRSAHDEERANAALKPGQMALVVEHVGQYAPHDTAQKAGYRKNDLIVAWDGRSDLPRETDVIAHSLVSRKVGDKIKTSVIRDGKTLTLEFAMQP